MDIDPGMSLFSFHLSLLFIIFFLDVPVASAPVRLLPYSHVPGIAFTSPLFSKAVSVIAKQQSNVANTSSTVFSKKEITGMCSVFFFIHFLIYPHPSPSYSLLEQF